MTEQTLTPAINPFASDPFYAMGIADAYDEHHAGESVHDLHRRANEMLDTTRRVSQPADLYRVGYATAVIGLLNGHIAQIAAQSEVAQTWLARKQGRETAPLHQANRYRRR